MLYTAPKTAHHLMLQLRSLHRSRPWFRIRSEARSSIFRGSEAQRSISVFYSIIRTSTDDLRDSLASPGPAQSFPTRIANLLHTSLFLGTAGLRPPANTCFPSASRCCPSSFSFKIFEISECLGNSRQDDFYGRNDRRIFVEIQHGLELAGETVELYKRLFSMIFRGMWRFGHYNVRY